MYSLPPMRRIAPALLMHKIEPALPMLMMLPTLPMLEMLSKLLMLGKPVSLPAARLRLERVVLCMRVDLRAPPD